MMTELNGHPYFVASQFHPEYKTRPLRPTPLFLGFVLESAGLWDEYAANGSVMLCLANILARLIFWRRLLLELLLSR
jgi:hypothetical protein